MIWWAKIKTWAILVLGAVLAVLGVWFAGRHRGHEDAEADSAKRKVKNAELRATVDAETQALPDAPPQRVADADPSTAAGRLRDDGWTR